MKNRQLYLAAYDVSCPRRLRKALYVLRGFASGGQKSVFECLRIPVQSCHQFQPNAATHSISKLPLIPVNTATPKW